MVSMEDLLLGTWALPLKMRGKASEWGKPSTLTILYKPGLNQWFASITVEVPDTQCKFCSDSNLEYESIIAFDLGTETALTTYNGAEFDQITNPRFTQVLDPKIKQVFNHLEENVRLTVKSESRHLSVGKKPIVK